MAEIWKPVNGYEGFYEVSNLGRIKSLERKIKNNGAFGKEKYITKSEKVVSTYKNKNGYSVVQLYKSKKREVKLVHRLVAEAFIPNPNNLPNVLHIIAISKGGTNIVSNLYWGTQEENIKDRTRDGNDRGVKVLQFDLKGNLINKWKSIAEASRETGISYMNIHRHCKNKMKILKDFVWKYESEVI